MEELYKKILIEIGEDVSRDGLLKTPQRAAEAMRFLTKGYNEKLEDVVNDAIFEAEMHDMVISKNIEIYSTCEHHMLPFFGKCHIGYIPSKKVIGVSKLSRIADMYSRRFQIQERLTHQIAEAVYKVIEPIGVGVVIEAQHLCMMMRGVEKQNSVMQTSSMLGAFRKNESTRLEFLHLIKP